MVALLGLLSTACFTMRGFSFSLPYPKPGQVNVLTMKFQPTGVENTKDYPFVIVALEIDDTSGGTGLPYLKVVKPKVFDTTHNFGATSRPFVQDNALRDFILANDTCIDNGVDGSNSNFRYVAFRTAAEINDKLKMGKFAITKLGLKVKPSTETGLTLVQLASGFWNDDGDGTPEPGGENGDTMGCTAEVQTSMAIHQPPQNKQAPSSFVKSLIQKFSGK
jgi:hypothetical protein